MFEGQWWKNKKGKNRDTWPRGHFIMAERAILQHVLQIVEQNTYFVFIP